MKARTKVTVHCKPGQITSQEAQATTRPWSHWDVQLHRWSAAMTSLKEKLRQKKAEPAPALGLLEGSFQACSFQTCSILPALEGGQYNPLKNTTVGLWDMLSFILNCHLWPSEQGTPFSVPK